jgi:hypothetical protein
VDWGDVWYTFWLVKVFLSLCLSLYDSTIPYIFSLKNYLLIKFSRLKKKQTKNIHFNWWTLVKLWLRNVRFYLIWGGGVSILCGESLCDLNINTCSSKFYTNHDGDRKGKIFRKKKCKWLRYLIWIRIVWSLWLLAECADIKFQKMSERGRILVDIWWRHK